MASHPTDRQMHPILIDVRQIAPNQILMMYDLRTDLESATNVANYWIRSNSVRPTGISGVGMSPALSAANAIRPDMGMMIYPLAALPQQ